MSEVHQCAMFDCDMSARVFFHEIRVFMPSLTVRKRVIIVADSWTVKALTELNQLSELSSFPSDRS